ncbi:netrin-B [Contarinia nasturtii]|uniref:netrin-B n=1 Tax=Contarinia nasturtii TaxID=265458 RepID=UPI0012D40BAF|nr:netrin-B [Contarinia nasturtii]
MMIHWCNRYLIVLYCVFHHCYAGYTFGEDYPKKSNYVQALQTDPCYSDDRAKRCIPDFVNAAYGSKIVASSVCGQNGPSRYCEPNDVMRPYDNTCYVCDRSDPQKTFSPAALTDLNNPNNVTCWRSDPIQPPNGPNAPPDNVTLTLNLGKKFELTYVSLQFCPKSLKPDSIAIYKSADYGVTWQPFQFYSSQCRRVYGRPNRAPITKANEQEARCSDTHRHSGDLTSGMYGGRIAFSTLEGRPSASNFDQSAVLQDWVTVTDIKIIFHRLQMPSDVLDEELMIEQTKLYSNKLHASDSMVMSKEKKSPLDNLVSSTMSTMSTQNYAVSDFAVGGRCKCNGHASRCLTDDKGQLYCDCKHNTAGRDCEKCKPYFFDRPWGRATYRDANECKACDCNGHARRCRFNMELYKLSGRVSGGVCLNCRHATTGRHCHYCKAGYYRDPSKSIGHRKVCKPCDCHPIGSSGKTCNHTSGQCPCKDGVTGLTCNRCARGYQQSRSHITPCIKIPRVITALQQQNTAPEVQQYDSDPYQTDSDNGGGGGGSGRECGKCKSGTKRLNLNKFCKRDYAIMGRIVEREPSRYAKDSPYQSTKFNIQIQAVFKKSQDSAATTVRKSVPLIISAKDLECRCPKLKANRSYLILGKDIESPSGTVGIGPRSIVIEWKDDWYRRMKRFQRRDHACG